ncbi:MAG: hypothetical protein AB8F95_20820 [Bacteroidia bacterium]
MSTLELKAYLHQIIANANDEHWLNSLLEWVQGNVNQETFSEVSKEVVDAINEGIADIEAKNTVSHKEMQQKYSQWLSK